MFAARIEELCGDSNKAEVTTLDLQNCEATSLDGLTEDFENVTTLTLANNKLNTLKAFPSWKTLTTLDLKSNHLLGGLDHLSGCVQLKSLDLSDNAFETVEQLEPLKDLPALENVKLTGCPISKTADYKDIVFAALPHLLEIDGTTRDTTAQGERTNGSHNGVHAAVNGEGDTSRDETGVDQLLRDDLEDDDEEYCPEGEEEDEDEDDDDDEVDEDEEGDYEEEVPAEARGVKRKHEEDASNPADEDSANGQA